MNRGIARNNYLGGPGCNRDILRRSFFSPLYGYFISRLIWTGYEKHVEFHLVHWQGIHIFVYVILYYLDWILEHLEEHSLGIEVLTFFSIDVLSFEWLISFFLKNASIVCHLLIIWHLISNPPKKINSKNWLTILRERYNKLSYKIHSYMNYNINTPLVK